MRLPFTPLAADTGSFTTAVLGDESHFSVSILSLSAKAPLHRHDSQEHGLICIGMPTRMPYHERLLPS